MVVISLSITASTNEIVAGIPQLVSLSTNIAASIFFTLDGTDPTLFSTIYTGSIQLPTNLTKVVLKAFATNGVDSSPIITTTYQTNLLGQDARTPHSGTNAPPNSTQGLLNLEPFGSPPIMPGQQFLGAGAAGLTVDDPALPQTPTGFDASGNPTGFTNNQSTGLPAPDFAFTFSDTDVEGKQGHGIGTLPPHTLKPVVAPPEQSDPRDRLFDPKALVIFQDSTQPFDPLHPSFVMRQSFTLEDAEHTRTGNQFFNTGPDAPPNSGTFLRQHFDPTNNTIRYYHYDSWQNRWVINVVPFKPKPDQFNYANVVFRKGEQGAGRVFQWVLWKPSYLT